MFARTTLFEIDTLRTSLDDALQLFKENIVPAMETQPGYMGSYAMRTNEGKGLMLTFWATEADATAGVESGYYEEQIAKFITFFRAPPGREHYEVVYAKVPEQSPA